jgi:hypothetical protein
MKASMHRHLLPDKQSTDPKGPHAGRAPASNVTAIAIDNDQA